MVSNLIFILMDFKARDTETSVNTNGDRFIYAAFAESPFKNSQR